MYNHVLIVGTQAYIARGVSSIMEQSSIHRCYCPECGQQAYRVQWRLYERLVSLIVPVRRYHCSSCGWRGLVRKGTRAAALWRRSRIVALHESPI
jgi:transposase-like protein